MLNTEGSTDRVVKMFHSTSLSIRCEVEGELATQFETVKRSRGLKNNTEVVRSLIREEYLRLNETRLRGPEAPRQEVS